MIQRVQTLFLLGVIICMALMLFFPIWEKVSTTNGEVLTLTAFSLTHVVPAAENGTEQIINEQPTYYIAILAVLAALVAGYSIFRYDNRLTQIKLAALNSLIMAAVIGTAWYFATQAEPMLISETNGKQQLGFFLPLIALLFNLMANRFIRKDEKLVRSADRFR